MAASPLQHAQSGLDPRRLVAANDAAVGWFRTQLAAAEPPRRYLTARGLGTLLDREWPWRLGYAPAAWSALTDHLLKNEGFTPEELVSSGLSRPTREDPGRLIDVFRDRIMFPIRDQAGQVVGFIGRASPAALSADPQLPKYLNTRESPIYSKDKLLFGLAEQQDRISAGWRPVLVEGPADTIATWLSYSRSGPAGSVAMAPCGTALSATQAAIMRSMPGADNGLVVAFDGDEAGRKAADSAFKLLHDPAPPGPLLAAEFGAGADPADLLTRPNGRAQLRAALRQQTRPLLVAVVDHHLDRMVRKFPRTLQEIEGRFDAAHALASHVLQAASPHEAAWIAQYIARRTHLDVSVVVSYAADRVLEQVARHELDQDKRLAAAGASRPPPAAIAFPRMRAAGVMPITGVGAPSGAEHRVTGRAHDFQPASAPPQTGGGIRGARSG